ncbi:MAG: Glu/Leu/Phe/Val dehydrogenase [Candidatus Brennerbacteria bacterium]|nr:Glu/Leu/Phe/Val dehydrogenase [Candidatus Brennerbacteria bacterium]
MRSINAKKIPGFDNHRDILSFSDEQNGITGFIAIHKIKSGIAIGGTRYWHYDTPEKALSDALRLSKAMTYKCALAGVPYGGGKGIIAVNSKKNNKSAILKAYAKKLNSLKGIFYTGQDIGLTQNDVKLLAKESSYIVGRPNLAGDPGSWAGLGVFYAIQAVLEKVLGQPDVAGKKFTVKGIGKVGWKLCELLLQNKADVTAADINPKIVKSARKILKGIKIANPDEIHRLATDVYCPCALGREITAEKINQLKCRIVCGGANNQLASPEIDNSLFQRGIVYIPDYVANAGGLISVAAELDKNGYEESRVLDQLQNIKINVKKIVDLSKSRNKPPGQTADQLAEFIFN